MNGLVLAEAHLKGGHLRNKNALAEIRWQNPGAITQPQQNPFF